MVTLYGIMEEKNCVGISQIAGFCCFRVLAVLGIYIRGIHRLTCWQNFGLYKHFIGLKS